MKRRKEVRMFYKIPVGAEVWINDVLVRCVEDDGPQGCLQCVFHSDLCKNMYCSCWARPDGLNVHFERV
jgi:hypothetical protein